MSTFLGKTGAGVVLAETAADDFLDETGELEVDFLCWNGEVAGSAPIERRKLLLLSSTILSGSNGSGKTMSATRGDSVSLKAKSSVSVCFDAFITSTHFSVHTPISLYCIGPVGSSITLHSPTPMLLVGTTAGPATAARNLSVVVSSLASNLARHVAHSGI